MFNSHCIDIQINKGNNKITELQTILQIIYCDNIFLENFQIL